MNEIDQSEAIVPKSFLPEVHQDGCTEASNFASCLEVERLDNLMNLVSELSRLATECQSVFNSVKK